MPQYTRTQLLEAVRTDHPEFKSVGDDDLFKALSIDHPELVSGISGSSVSGVSVVTPKGPVTDYTIDATGKTLSLPSSMPETRVKQIIDGHIRAVQGKPQQPASAKATVIPTSAGPIPMPENVMGAIRKVAEMGKMTPRAAMRTGGAIIGGAIGGTGGTILGTPLSTVPGAAMGGAAGASIGESAYQLGQRLIGGKDAPQSGEEAAQQQAGAMTQGALQEAIPPYITGKVPGMLKAGAQQRIAEAVRPSGALGTKETIRDVSKDVVDKFPVARTGSQLLTKLTSLTDDAGRAVTSEYATAAQSGARIRSAPIVQRLQQARQAWVSSGNAPGTEGPLKAYDEMIDYFSSQKNFSVDELRKNKQIWDKLTNFSRGSVSKEPLKEEVYNEAANAAREQIHAAFPSTAKADRLFHVWNSLKESLYKADVANTGRQVGHLGDIPFAVVGGAAGSALGGPGGAAGGTIIGIALRELPQTVAWKTASVSARAAAIQALANQNVKLAIKALSAGASAKAQDELQAKFAP